MRPELHGSAACLLQPIGIFSAWQPDATCKQRQGANRKKKSLKWRHKKRIVPLGRNSGGHLPKTQWLRLGIWHIQWFSLAHFPTMSNHHKLEILMLRWCCPIQSSGLTQNWWNGNLIWWQCLEDAWLLTPLGWDPAGFSHEWSHAEQSIVMWQSQ